MQLKNAKPSGLEETEHTSGLFHVGETDGVAYLEQNLNYSHVRRKKIYTKDFHKHLEKLLEDTGHKVSREFEVS